jgi:CRISPR-associated protein Csb2
MADAVALSVALAWNTCPPEESRSAPRGFARYRRLADSAYAKGLEVLSVRPLHETNAGDYVHKVPEGLMPLPYTALIRLGHLEGTGRAFAAIGQSRHLGGGLLVPCDLQSAVVESWGKK